jgi:hypothetical protein
VVPDWYNLRRNATAERTGRPRLHGDKTFNIGGCPDPCRLACHGATENCGIRECRPAHTGHELPVGGSITSPDSGRSVLGMFNAMGQHANGRRPQ